MDNSFKYIRDNKGIDTESSYPYYARVSCIAKSDLFCCSDLYMSWRSHHEMVLCSHHSSSC